MLLKAHIVSVDSLRNEPRSSSKVPAIFRTAPVLKPLKAYTAPRRNMQLDAPIQFSQVVAALSYDAKEPASSLPEDLTWDWREHPDSYCIVNFYHLVDVPEPEKVVEEHRCWVLKQQLDIRGRIYISSQGINSQYGGIVKDATAYISYLATSPLFQGIRFSVWPADDHMFPKLRLKYRPSLISLHGGMTSLPITDPAARATPVAPEDWRRMLDEAKKEAETTGKKPIVLDIRNNYEWDAGHFWGADRPAEEVFHETPVGDEPLAIPEPLKGLDKDAPVMMYCTGGIRCDVYSTFLRRQGYNKLYTLEGGIQNYLKTQGPQHWRGSLFVFDGRMALPSGNTADEGGQLPAAVPCQLCGGQQAQVPHVNCANIDCNELFIACNACKARLNGCCCEQCMAAPRLLRPVKMEGGHYGTWIQYADEASFAPLMSSRRSHEGRVARRARRRAALQGKREEHEREKAARKHMVREAMARLEQLEMQQQGQQQEQEPEMAR